MKQQHSVRVLLAVYLRFLPNEWNKNTLGGAWCTQGRHPASSPSPAPVAVDNATTAWNFVGLPARNSCASTKYRNPSRRRTYSPVDCIHALIQHFVVAVVNLKLPFFLNRVKSSFSHSSNGVPRYHFWCRVNQKPAFKSFIRS